MEFIPPPPVEDEEPQVVKLTAKQKKAIAKAAAKERRRLAKLEDTKLILRDEFQRELELSKKQAAKLNSAWNEVVHATKIKELKTELRVWFEKMDRNLKAKDEVIETLLSDIDQVHILQKKAFHRHMKTIDYLNESFKVLADYEQKIYERESTALITQFLEEMHDFEKKEKDVLRHLADIEINRCLYTEAELEDDFQIYVQRMDERILQEIFRRFDYRDATLQSMREKYNDVVQHINDLKSSTYDPDQESKLEQALEKHKYYTIQLERMKDYEMKVNKIYSDLQKEFVHEELDSQKKLHNLDIENKYFMKAYNRLKKEKDEFHNLTTEQMKVLTLEGRRVLKFYREKFKKGQLLMALVAECRKFQTQKEKIIVTDSQVIDDEEVKKLLNFTIETMNLYENLDISEESLFAQFYKMKKFWKHVSDVTFQNKLLEREKDELEAENEKLVGIFKRIHRREPTAKDLEGSLLVADLPTPQKHFKFPNPVCL